MAIDTCKVEGRRKLAYATLDEILADADRLASSPMKALGNWSAGQVFRHLANAYNGSIDGLPATFPWYFRLMGRIFKKKLLGGPMPSGLKVPPELAREVMPGPTSTEEGLAELHAAVLRLEREPHRARHPIFGDISRDEWNQIHLSHANLHMSFLVPQ